MPTHKSATARLAKKKLVMVRILRCRTTTRITNRFPEEIKGRHEDPLPGDIPLMATTIGVSDGQQRPTKPGDLAFRVKGLSRG